MSGLRLIADATPSSTGHCVDHYRLRTNHQGDIHHREIVDPERPFGHVRFAGIEIEERTGTQIALKQNVAPIFSDAPAE